MKLPILTLFTGLAITAAQAAPDPINSAPKPLPPADLAAAVANAPTVAAVAPAIDSTTSAASADTPAVSVPDAIDEETQPTATASTAAKQPVALAANSGTIVEMTDEAPFAPIDTVDNFEVLPESGSPEIALLLNDNINPLFWQGAGSHLHNLADVRHLYATMNYRPLWTDNNHVTPLAMQLIDATQNAWQHALRPEAYHTQATAGVYAGQAIAEAAAFDIILTDAFITFKKHLANGIVDPKQQFSTWNARPEELDFSTLYRQAFQRGRLDQVLSVNDPDYRQLQQAYIAAVSQPAEQTPEIVQVPVKKMKLGSRGAAVSALRARLGLPADSDKYDKTVRQAVKDYQRNNGLAADGVAGANTISHMNGQRKGNRTEQLAINMERLRWGQTPARGNYVWVNIPAYKMAIRNGNNRVFESDVIVGRPERPTPIFHDTMEHVVLAPYWNVPSTIFKEDKLPLLQKNPNALGKNMQVLNTSTGKVVKASSVNWKSGGKGYRLRQLPGPRNSLGRMKFLFPNRHAIYLHDTPNRRLFKKSRRAFSSGCIRVARAEDLAVFLLKDQGYNRDKIKRTSRKTKEKWVNLNHKKRYPVFLNYYTAWADSDGAIKYSADIYNYDKPLKKMYKAALNNF